VNQIPHDPSPADYVKYAKRPTRGGHGIAAVNELELDRSCGGDICYDKAAYQQAEQEYRQATYGKKSVSLKEYLEKTAIPSMQMRSPAANPLKPAVYSPTMETGSAAVLGNVGQKSADAYQAAADEIEKVGKDEKNASPKTDVFVVVDPESIRIP
jgi:hypothetical protein